LWKYDEKGVPYYYYGKLGFQRNPFYIAREATNNYDENSTANLNRELLINNANWLVANSYKIANFSVIPYKFPLSHYNLTAPWFSSMAQAHALVAMMDAYNVTHDHKYLDFSKSLLNSFFVDAKNGGVTYKTTNNGWWYEEYASKNSTKPHVLNGMLLTLLDIYKYYEYTHDPSAKLLFDEGYTAVIKNLNRYNYLGYSFYDITRKPAGIAYQKFHVSLLNDLLSIQKNDTIKKIYTEWANFRGSYPKNLKL
jgi:hypothetical protein